VLDDVACNCNIRQAIPIRAHAVPVQWRRGRRPERRRELYRRVSWRRSSALRPSLMPNLLSPRAPQLNSPGTDVPPSLRPERPLPPPPPAHVPPPPRGLQQSSTAQLNVGQGGTLVPPYTHRRVPLSHTGAKAQAWCLLINVDASLFKYLLWDTQGGFSVSMTGTAQVELWSGRV